ncbi:hypothetical protein EZS27_024794 [termite gut metagenome]|uniref:Uncharacterized protein n=1 Tax=termite gut metagenome TaxID=433724 RepID=A0A5J4QXR6_9ZZZZ
MSSIGKPTLLTSIGMALAFVGVPLGMYFNFIFPVVKWSPIFMFLSVLLMISYRNLYNLNFPSFNGIFKYILFFQFLMLSYGVISERMTQQYLTFHLYIIATIIALSTRNSQISYNKVIETVFVFSSICVILGAYFLWNGLVVGEEAWQIKQVFEDWALEPFTVARGAVINLSCILFMKNTRCFFYILFAFFIVLDTYILFASTKRTPIFVSGMIVLVFLYKKGFFQPKKILQLMRLLSPIIIVSIILYINVESIKDTIDNFYSNFYNGVLNLFGDTHVKDETGSAIARLESRQWAYNYINGQFAFSNYLFGGGYMIRWLDNPILQSYLDMGIIGIVSYVYLIIIFPIKNIFKRLDNTFLFFVTLQCLYNILSSINSGNPYLYIKYVPVCFLAFALRTNSMHKIEM